MKTEQFVAKLKEHFNEMWTEHDQDFAEKLYEEVSRCLKPFHDGSICQVRLDCHLHDWRQKETLPTPVV